MSKFGYIFGFWWQLKKLLCIAWFPELCMLGPGKDTNGFPQFPNVPLTVLVEGFLSKGINTLCITLNLKIRVFSPYFELTFKPKTLKNFARSWNLGQNLPCLWEEGWEGVVNFWWLHWPSLLLSFVWFTLVNCINLT